MRGWGILLTVVLLATGAPTSWAADHEITIPTTLDAPSVGSEGRMATLKATTEVQAPPGKQTLTNNLVGATGTHELTADPDVPAGATYEFLFRASPIPGEPSRAGLFPRAGVGHTAWAYGALAAGSEVRDGDRLEHVIVGDTPYPSYPPAPVEPGGQLAWAPVEPMTASLSSIVHHPETGQAYERTMNTVAISAELRVEGGGLVAPDGASSPTLEIPLPGFETGFAASSRLAGLPGIGAVWTSTAFTDDESGGKALELTVHLPEGTAWPETTDDGPSGTWAHRIHILAVDLSDEAVPVQQEGATHPAQGALLDLGPIPPGMQASLLTPDGAHHQLPPTVSTTLALDGRGGIETLREAPWPSPEVYLSGPAEDPSPAASEGDDCGTEHATAGAGSRLAAGAVRFDLTDDGTAEGLCLSGVPVGALGLPAVEIDGLPHAPVWDGGAPRVTEYAFETGSGFHGNVAILQYAGTAGPTRIDVQVFLMNTDRGGFLQAIVWDHHTPGNHAPLLRLAWMLDPDAGSDEAFHAAGVAPMLSEGSLPADGTGTLLGAEPPHTVTAPGDPREHLLRVYTPTTLTVHARDGLLAGETPESAALPPEPLLGADVAVHVPTLLVGPHLHFYLNRAPAVNEGLGPIPAPASGFLNLALALGPIVTGQVGLTWQWEVQGYQPG